MVCQSCNNILLRYLIGVHGRGGQDARPPGEIWSGGEKKGARL